MHVYIFGTLDTKGPETLFVKESLTALGVPARIVDTGSAGEPTVEADVSREELFEAAGTSWEAMKELNHRGVAVTNAALGAARLMERWHAVGDDGIVSGVFGLGGSAGTTIGTAAMRALPLGVPKVMVSTLASGQVRQYVGDSDILMLNAVVDILGVNRISRVILHEACRALAGMVLLPRPEPPAKEKPLVAATMFGVTTACVSRAKEVLEEAGYEVLVFHATGNGGQAMEALISQGLFSGVLDLTTTELADELVGGILSAGPDRLRGAGRLGVPQVISVGALDMVNFGPIETVPEKFRHRQLHQHNANVTLMRTTVAENRTLGEWIGQRAEATTGPVAILLPLQGVSAIDHTGQPFDDPAAREALFEGIRRMYRGHLYERDCHINDRDFAELAAKLLLRLMKVQPRSHRLG